MKRFKPYFLILNFSLFIVLTGCRKDLCYNHDEHSFSVKVDIVADWEQEWERMHDMDWEQNWPEDCSCG